MATHYLKLEDGVTAKEIKAKFAAFTLLYGEGKMILRGSMNELHKGKLMPISLSEGAEITKITPTRLYAETKREGGVEVHLGYMQTGMGYGVPKPEIMFITDR